MKPPRKFARGIFEELSSMDLFDLVPRLTLVLLILHAGHYWYLHIPMTIVCTFAIVCRPVYRSPDFWLIVTVIMAAGNLREWYTIDNHKYLMSYWCLALFVSLLAKEKRRVLNLNARFLTGLGFGFATIWKAISTDYLSGRFFHFTLLLDDRFEEIAQGVAGLTAHIGFQNQQFAAELLHYDSRLQSVELLGGPLVEPTAQAITWFTLFIEFAIAAAFLAPDHKFVVGARHMLLIGFGLTTYLVANVVGFGWLLMVMGVASCPPDWHFTRLAYVVTFFLIQLYTVPWWEIGRTFLT